MALKIPAMFMFIVDLLFLLIYLLKGMILFNYSKTNSSCNCSFGIMATTIQHRSIHPGFLIPRVHESLIFLEYFSKSIAYPLNVILVIIPLTQIYFYFNACNRVHFIGYLPFYLIYLYILNTNLLQSKITKTFLTLSDGIKNVFMPNIYDMEPELRKVVNSASFRVELSVLYFWACTLITISMSLYDLLFYEDRLMLQSFFSKDSILYQITRIVLCCLVALTVIPTVLSPMQLIVGLFYSQIQILQLLDKIKKFERQISNEYVDNQCILENLKIFGQLHLDIRSLHYNAFKSTQLYSTIYSTTGLVGGISSLIAMFSYNAPKGPALLNLFVYISFLYGLPALIQKYEDTLKHLSDALYNLKWYMWAAKCQKFHLLLIGQVAQEFKIPILFLLHVDFELIKRFLKIIYTATNCLITLRQKN